MRVDQAIRPLLFHGAACVPEAVDPALVKELQASFEDGPFEHAEEEIGPVRQQLDAYTIGGPFRGPLRELARELTEALRHTGVRGLATWRPNEAAVQRYQPGSTGITPHLDGKKFRRVVAVLTTQGHADLSVHEIRSGPPVKVWRVGPGDLLLLRAPGLDGARDGRPFHAISAPETGLRYSVGLRMRRDQ